MARKGFTLIELLVVIAIIAILAAILFPVFARARMKAQQSNCLSNMKQIALGNAMYMSDNDQKVINFPANWMTPSWTSTTNSVTPQMYCLMPYVKNIQIFNCPTSKNSTPNSGQDYETNMCALNAGNREPVYYSNGCRGGNNPVKDSEMNAASTMIGYDGAGNSWNSLGYTSRNGDAGPSDGGYYMHISDRHSDGTNVNFYDGHAKWMKLGAIFSSNAGVSLPLANGGSINIDASDRTGALCGTAVPSNPWWTGANES
ncbi:MAG TPA: prepilin-type N-terminal cleavage/methylation domain-containing protein [Armatimonadota bacterium]|jgi:prepilin-type N-terminal cleavage/methylation domain-containing protein/prepilin-type processing-associated H-X9-DG protein